MLAVLETGQRPCDPRSCVTTPSGTGDAPHEVVGINFQDAGRTNPRPNEESGTVYGCYPWTSAWTKMHSRTLGFPTRQQRSLLMPFRLPLVIQELDCFYFLSRILPGIPYNGDTEAVRLAAQWTSVLN